MISRKDRLKNEHIRSPRKTPAEDELKSSLRWGLGASGGEEAKMQYLLFFAYEVEKKNGRW